jgi:hypothetical protein
MEQYRLRGREQGRQQVPQARLQVPGYGRGGLKKRAQASSSTPGPWDTVEDAAVMRAVIIRGFIGIRRRQDPPTPRRSRTSTGSSSTCTTTSLKRTC